MRLTSGAQLGPYEILEPVGAGGMGEVYKARDTRLGRTVAVKVSGGEFSERFEREARSIAALNHPNICQLYDVGPDYLVMEYIDGRPLKGPMPAGEAVKLALQILDALEAAHRIGIIHRDLKPANILATKSGVKVLDFGLAKRQEKPSAAGEQSTGGARGSSTLPLTAPFTVIGTPQYMSPEQIEGREVDQRSDIFAFGCVLYEMLTGCKAFNGRNDSAIVAAVLATEPRPISEIRKGVATPALERVVQTCLAKDLDERWQSVREVRHALEWAAAEKPPRRTEKPTLAWAAAGILAAAVPLAWFLHPKPPAPPLMKFSIPAPEGTTFEVSSQNRYAISPDGKTLAFVALSGGKRGLFIRPLDKERPQPLAGTEDAIGPFWSPNSRWLCFFADGKLMKTDVNDPSSTPQRICDVVGATHGDWDGENILIEGPKGQILKVSADGGTPSPVLPLDASLSEQVQREPQFLPDGSHFLFRSYGKTTTVSFASLDGKRHRLMDDPYSPGFYSRTGDGRNFLLFVLGSQDSQLMAQPFDPKDGKLQGEAQRVARDVSIGSSFSASDNGVLVFRHAMNTAQLTWFDRAGGFREVAKPGQLSAPRLSPDQKTVALYRYDRGKPDIEFCDVKESIERRFTHDDKNVYPVWSPDGTSIIYASVRTNESVIVEQPLNRIGESTVLLRSQSFYAPQSCSRDGRWVVLRDSAAQTLYLLPRASREAKETDLVRFQEAAVGHRDGSVSPDGHWMLYSSTQGGLREVFVQTMPGVTPEAKSQISENGGGQPVWSADGQQIFYVSADSRIMSVRFQPKDSLVKPPQPLFQTRLDYDALMRGYDVTADGARFIVANPLPEVLKVPITVILNWTQSPSFVAK